MAYKPPASMNFSQRLALGLWNRNNTQLNLLPRGSDNGDQTYMYFFFNLGHLRELKILYIYFWNDAIDQF